MRDRRQIYVEESRIIYVDPLPSRKSNLTPHSLIMNYK